ncbi:MAG: YbhB/YbcL family Raf kinase inhibitor-like protein [Nanoarchaeota archaeon]
MKIKSAFNDGKEIPKKYTCDGENISPPLEISDIPKKTKSLAIIMDDPDAPAKVWVHWIIWNIPIASTSIKIEENGEIFGIKGANDSQELEYSGPCPPSGTHRYFFKVYALDDNLSLPKGASKEELEDEMQNHIIEKSQLIGTYSKK